MIGKNNNYLKNIKKGTKVESYSIKKFKIGAASVVIGAGIFFGMGAIDSNDVKAADEGNKITENSTLDKDKKVEEKEVVKVEEKETPKATNTEEKSEKTEVSTKEEKKEEKKVVEEKVTAEKETPKTTPIPATNTEPKEGTNSIANSGSRDLRNGKPLTEGTAFRDAEASAEVIETEPAEAPKLDKAPLSADDQKNHFKKFQDEKTKKNKDLDMLNKQLFFIDWSDEKAVSKMGNEIVHGEFKGREILVGSTWEKEITPGYIVRVEVTKLENIIGEANGVVIKEGSPKYKKIEENNGDPKERYAHRLVAYKENYNGYSAAYEYGLNANGLTAISGEIHLPGFDQSPGELINVGVTFKISATYKGRTVKPAFFAVSAEEAGNKEVEIYKTNGKGWELLTELMNSKVSRSFNANDKGWLASLAKDMYKNAGYDTDNGEKKDEITKLTNAMSNAKITTETVSVTHPNDSNLAADGLGTQTFGPVYNKKNTASTPIVVTRGATEVSAYLVSAGAQAFSFGVLALDEGDASSSYGEALHTISIGRDKDVHHPYIGKTVADLDEKNLEKTKPDWIRDEKTDDEDEGPGQLMGDNVVKGANNEDYYTLHKVNEGTYELKIDVHRGDGNDKSYVRAWIDFNNNGKFDDDEASELVTVTQDGAQTLRFTNKYQNVDTTVETLGMRVRTALADHDIATPTGYAFSGEVEDFKIQQTLPPRGEKKQTSDVQGKKQSTKIEFNAYGKKDYDFNTKNEIDTTVAPKIFKTDGTEVKDSDLQDGYYVVPGEGKYKVTADGKDVNVEFIPEAGFVGKAKGIIIRRTDINKTDSGWGKIAGRTIVGGEGENGDIFNVNSAPTNTMDGYYAPIVTPKPVVGTPGTSKDIQNAPQEKTLVFTNEDKTDIPTEGLKKVYSLKDAGDDGKLVVYKDAEKKEKIGTYSIDAASGKVTFQPVPSYTETAPAATVVLTVTPENMEKDTTLTEDEKKLLTKTAEATFIPTVIGVTPSGKDAKTKDVQGQPQTAKILLNTEEKTDDLATVNFDKGTTTEVTDDKGQPKSVELDENTLIMLKGDEEVTEMDAMAGDKVVGKYKLDQANKTITFTPNKDYDGKTPVTPAKLRIYDQYKNKAIATYTPEVVAVTPTAEKAITKDIQGATQTAPIVLDTKEDPTKENTINFDKGSVKLTEDGEDKVVELDPKTLTLMNGSGAVDEVDAIADGNKVGTFKLDKENKTVIFTPNKDYTGEKPVDPVTIRIADTNGTEATTTYTPTVVGVTPSGKDAKTKDIQGAVQTGKPELKAGSAEIDGVKKEVPLDDEVAAKLVDSEGKDLPLNDKGEYVVKEVGTYKVTKDGIATFTPEKTFKEKADGVLVRRVDKNGTPVDAKYTPEVVGITPTATPAETEDVQGMTQTAPVILDEKEETDNKATVNFDKGTAADLKDENGNPKSVDLDISTLTLLDGDNEVTELDAKAGDKVVGKYILDKDNKTIKFVPTPEYDGTTPVEAVTIQIKDKNGTKVTTTYTPKVIAVTITPKDAVSEKVQGLTQSGKPTFESSSDKVTIKEYKLIDPSDNTEKEEVVIEGKGKYKVASDGTVTFIPNSGYVGEAPINVIGIDSLGRKTTPAKYTPTTTKIDIQASDVKTKDIQGLEQNGKPTFNLTFDKDTEVKEGTKLATFTDYKLVDPKDSNKTVEKVEVDGVGTYTIDKDGKVIFTPKKDYKGETPTSVGVRATLTIVNENGDSSTLTKDAIYTPTVVPTTPTATPAETEDVQGMTQTAPIVLDEKETPDAITTVNFDKGGAVVIEGENPKTVDLDEDTLTLLDGNKEVLEIDAKAGDKVVGKYILDKDNKTIKFVPNLDYDGTTPVEVVTVQIKDKNGTTVTTTYTPKVVAVKLDSKEVTSVGKQGATQTGTPTFTTNNEKVTFEKYELIDPKTNTPTEVVKVDGEGTYTVDSTSGKVTFTPEAGYSTEKDKEAVGVTVRATASNKLTKDAKYTPKVEKVTAQGSKKETVGKQGEIQTGTPIFTISDESHVKDENGKVNVVYTLEGADEEGKVVVENEGTYIINKESGEVTFKPLLSYVTAENEVAKGVKVKATYTLTSDKDKENKVTTTTIDALGEYVPKVTPVTLSHIDGESINIQGSKQIGTPTFSADDKEVTFKGYTLIDPKTNTSAEKVVIENEGIYTINKESGEVTFIPEADFVTKEDKKAQGVTVRATASNNLTEDAKYTPTVIEVTPTGEKSETEGVQGAKQTSKAIFDKEDKDSSTLNFAKGSITLNEGDNPKSVDLDISTLTLLDGNKEVTTLVVKDKDGEVVGTYTVDKEKGEVVFQPVLSFVGVAPSVTVQIKDKNGTKATTTYTPKVTELVLSHEDVTSSKVQGSKQSSTPNFKVPILPEGVKVKEVVYTFADGTTTPKEIENVGIYTINPQTGEVTFSPRGKDKTPFVGEEKGIEVKATYTLVSQDNKEVKLTAVAKYTPTVSPLEATGGKLPSENLRGKVQNVDIKTIFTKPKLENGAVIEKEVYTFEDGSVEKVVKDEGKYTINEKGEVTFTPLAHVVGQLKGVKVKATYVVKSEDGYVFEVLANGEYLPEIKVGEPTSKPATSIDSRRKVQTGTPEFIPATATVNNKEVVIPFDKNVMPVLVDEKGDEVKLNEKGEYVVAGEGKYTISAAGVVTFTPEDDFTGVAKGVFVRRVDELGTAITAKYTPTVLPETIYIDKDGKELLPPKDGTKDKENIDGYRLVDTKKDEKGNVVYIYEKIPTPTPSITVITRYVDKDGKELLPSKEGKKAGESITGYRLIRTEVDAKGNIIHIYEKVANAITPINVKVEEKATKVENVLPNTNAVRTDEETAILTALGILGILGVYSRRKKH